MTRVTIAKVMNMNTNMNTGTDTTITTMAKRGKVRAE